MALWRFYVIQSLSQIQNIVVVPSKHQISVHPQTGKKERVFVDLAAIYPTPEEQGTELSFEEIMATNRGWLDLTWENDVVDENLVLEPVLVPLKEIEEISQGVAQKLVVHQDAMMFDENGAVIQPPREPRPSKKKKMIEVNETQISK